MKIIMMKFQLTLLMMKHVMAVDREMTVSVPAGKEECFFETVAKGYTLTVEYQVVDGGSGQLSELDINFRIVTPKGHPLVAEFKKSEGTHSQTVDELGDYKICFDNQFSYVSSKTIYFEVINENEDEEYDDLAGIFDDEEGDYESEYVDITVSDIETKLKKIKEDIKKAIHLQDQIRVTDLKDRSVMEHNFERVNFMSSFYVVVLMVSGLAQVFLLRSLFDEKSRINPLWKKAFND